MPRAAKEIVDIRSLARSHSTTAIRTLASIMVQPRTPANARIAAASELLNRGWGRPPQVLSGQDGGDLRIIIRQIRSEEPEQPLLIEQARD